MNHSVITDMLDAFQGSIERRLAEAREEGYQEGYEAGCNLGVEKTREHFKATLDEIPSEQDIADEIDKAYRDGWNDGRADLERERDAASALPFLFGEVER